MLALGARLAERGHEVTFETWSRWERDVEAAGMRFAAAAEYQVFPTPESPVTPYAGAVRAAQATRRLVAAVRPDVVVGDLITLAPALAAELEGVPVATLVPHVFPPGHPGLPPYAIGARMPRTAPGAAFWQGVAWAVSNALRRGREELNAARAHLGLPAVDRLHGGISERLCLVATLPQLEYPRRWPAHVRVVGPLQWEPPGEAVEPPAGEGPVVLVAPSTAQDREQRLMRAALPALAGLPVRVIATWNRTPPRDVPIPANARVVEWLSYARTMPASDLVLCHAGHGTLVRALTCGRPVVTTPAAGDMHENAARVAWAGVGVRVPRRLAGPRGLRLAVQRALEDPVLRARAAAIGSWSARHDAAGTAAQLVERLARGTKTSADTAQETGA